MQRTSHTHSVCNRNVPITDDGNPQIRYDTEKLGTNVVVCNMRCCIQLCAFAGRPPRYDSERGRCRQPQPNNITRTTNIICALSANARAMLLFGCHMIHANGFWSASPLASWLAGGCRVLFRFMSECVWACVCVCYLSNSVRRIVSTHVAAARPPETHWLILL